MLSSNISDLRVLLHCKGYSVLHMSCPRLLKPQFTMTQIEYFTNLGFPHLVNKYTGFPTIAHL